MAKKKSLRRALAGILAVLTVTGNMLAPTGIGKQLAETAIVAEAIDDPEFSAQKYAFDEESGTLYINGVIRTTGYGEDQRIDLRDHIEGFLSNTPVTGLGYDLTADQIQHVVIMFQAVLPANSNRLFKDFKNLQDVVVETGAKFDGDDSSIAHLSSTFEGCENLFVADLSGLTNGNRVAYIDGLFKDCPNLNYANLSSITGEMMGTGTATQLPVWGIFNRYWNGVDPVNEPTYGDDSLNDLILADSFVYNTINNLAATSAGQEGFVADNADELLDDLLESCDNKDQLKAQLLEQYNRYEAGQNYEAPEYTWSDDHMKCTATRKHKGNGGDTITETVDAEVTVTTPATCTEAGSKTYRAVFTNTIHFNPVTYTEDIPATGHSFDTFVGFEWSEDFTSAQAKFTCSHENCDEFELYDAEVASEITIEPTATAPGLKTYTASYKYQDANGEFRTVFDEKTDEVPAVQFTIRKRLVLNGTIKYEFAVETVSGLENPVLKLEREGVDAQTLEPTLKDGMYMFSINLPVKEMNDIMMLTLSGVYNGEEFEQAAEEYSFRTYLRNQMTNPNNDGNTVLKEQLATLAEFGARAQIFFNHNTENLANADLKNVYKEVELDRSVVTEAKAQIVSTCENAQAKFIGHTFQLESDTNMFLAFDALEGGEYDMNQLYIAYRKQGTDDMLKYNKVTGEKSQGLYYASIPGIPGNALNATYEYYLCTSEDGKTFTQISDMESYSAMCYAWSKISQNKDDALMDLVTAMMLYADASEAYAIANG